jgi:hypothetical protein
MRRKKPVEIVKIPSPKVNWDVVEQLKIGYKLPIKEKKEIQRINNEI